MSEQTTLSTADANLRAAVRTPSTLPWRKMVVVVAVLVVHGVLMSIVGAGLARPPLVTPPTIVGVLIQPEPLPITTRPEPVKPRPQPQPRAEAKPLPPLPKAEASEHAPTAPPTPPPVPAEPAPPAPPVAAPAPGPTKPAEPPLTPPRSDAAHLNNPAPVYPAMSRRLQESGRVVLEVYILANGQVGEVKLRQSSGYKRLDDAAVQAVRNWRYVPARRGDEAIPFWYVQALSFSLTD